MYFWIGLFSFISDVGSNSRLDASLGMIMYIIMPDNLIFLGISII